MNAWQLLGIVQHPRNIGFVEIETTEFLLMNYSPVVLCSLFIVVLSAFIFLGWTGASTKHCLYFLSWPKFGRFGTEWIHGEARGFYARDHEFKLQLKYLLVKNDF